MHGLRTAIRGTGEVMITLGLVLLLFCVYQLVWTNVEANAATDAASDDLREAWVATVPREPAPRRAARGAGSGAAAVAVTPANAFAFIHIPRLAPGYVKPIVEGVTPPIWPRASGTTRRRCCRAPSATSPWPGTGPPTASRSATSTSSAPATWSSSRPPTPGTRTR